MLAGRSSRILGDKAEFEEVAGAGIVHVKAIMDEDGSTLVSISKDAEVCP